MEKISSFKVDHINLNRGIYVSRVDKVGDTYVTTFDIRVKRPSEKRFLSAEASHTIEHICATYFRTRSYLRNNVTYFGPMGCLTGFYLILAGVREFTVEQVWGEVMRAFEEVSTWDGDIPGVSEEECGNPGLHSLDAAKEEAAEYLEFLKGGVTEENSEYPIRRLGIIVAMEQEVEGLKLALLEMAGKYETRVVVSGIGKVNAAIAAEKLISEFNPHLIISYGYSGGINCDWHRVAQQNVVVATSAKYHDVWCGDGEPLGQVQGLPEEFPCKVLKPVMTIAETIRRGFEGGKIIYGTVATGDKFADIDDLEPLIYNFPSVIAVDMESAAIAQTCFINGVRFGAVRLISDIVGAEDQAEQYKKNAHLEE